MYERNFHCENLAVQLGQFATFLDTSNISVTKLFESLVNFGIAKNQKMLPQVTKLSKLLLVLPATNAKSERPFSAMKHIKTYLRSTTSGNRLNHCKKTYQLNMIEIAKEFVGYNQATLQTFGMFSEH